MNRISYENAKCLVCGEQIPTTIKYVSRRGEYYDYDQPIEFFDTLREGYFVRLDKIENLESLEKRYNDSIESFHLSEKNKLKKEIDQISREDFRKLIEDKFSKDIEVKFQNDRTYFKYFLSDFRKDFDKESSGNYAISSFCMKEVLKNVERIGKAKYVIVGGDEKILRLKAKLKEDKFPTTFPFVSKKYGLDFLDSSNNFMIFEFAHFHEFPWDAR